MKRILALFGAMALMATGLAHAQLQVHSARWEVLGGGDSCDATRELVQACNGQRNCRLPVTEANLCDGDPAYGKLKVLDIKYSCDGRRQADVGFPDFSEATLRCERSRNAQLQVRSARWIADGAGSCDATSRVANSCNGKDSCQVYVQARYLCSDPAYGVVKHLDINYTCNGRPQPMARFTDGNLAALRCNGAPQWPVYRPPVQQPQPPVQMPEPVYHGGNGNSGGNGNYVGSIQVLNARWEVIGGGPWCDATPQFGRACNGRSNCQLPVEPNVICNGDPAPNRVKRVDVKYSCDGRVQPTVGFQDGTQAVLRCGNGNTGVVPPSAPSYLQITRARWEVNGGGAWCDATPQMVAACDGKKYCQVPVEPGVLCNGDPAPGRYKTLEVRYNCRGRPQSTVGFPDGSQASLRCD